MKTRYQFRLGKRQGFTLLELMLVMVIMVILASLTLPAIDRMLDGQKVDKGADLVRASLGRARVTAIRSGKVQAFICRPGSASMLVMPLESVDASSDMSTWFSETREANRSSNLDFSDEQLPRGVEFISSAVVDNNRSEFVMEESGSSMSSSASGSTQYVLFYPDGTCQDAQLTISNQAGVQKRIIVRALTGTARITDAGGQR